MLKIAVSTFLLLSMPGSIQAAPRLSAFAFPSRTASCPLPDTRPSIPESRREAGRADTSAHTAEQVLERYVQAIGGKDNVLKVRDMTTKMAATVQGMNIEGVQQRKAPNKMHMTLRIPGMGLEAMKVVSNGMRTLLTTMGNTQEMQGRDLATAKVLNTLFAELHYTELGVKPTLAGTEQINGADAYKLQIAVPGGGQVTEYYDAATGLKVRQVVVQEAGGQPAAQTTDLSDYREVAGVRVPHLLKTTFGPQTVELKVTSVEVNTQLPDDLFEVK